MTTQKQDIFDVISPDDDVFEQIEAEDSSIERLKAEMVSTLEKFDAKERKAENRRLSDEMKDFIRAEIAKIKPTQNVIERTIEKKIIEPRHIEPRVVQAPAAPPQIIKEVRVEVEKKDPTKYAKEDDVEALKERIASLAKQLAETKRMAESPIVIGGPGGPGVIGIPPPEGNPDDYVLTVNKGKAKWKAATGGGGTSSDAYAPTNVTTDRAFDANDTSIDEIADVLGSLIASLQGAGVIQ